MAPPVLVILALNTLLCMALPLSFTDIKHVITHGPVIVTYLTLHALSCIASPLPFTDNKSPMACVVTTGLFQLLIFANGVYWVGTVPMAMLFHAPGCALTGFH